MRARNSSTEWLASVMQHEEWRRRAGLVVWLGMATHLFTLAKGALLSDDYFITLRQVEHLFCGALGDRREKEHRA